MSGGGGDSQETTSDPWEGVQPYLGRGYRVAADQVLNRPTEFFPGQTYVDYSPETEQALAAQTERATGGNPLLGLGQQQVGQTLGGEFLGQNPYLDQLQQSVMSTVMPQVDSQFNMASGRFGSPAHAEAMGRGVSTGMAPYLFNEYGNERARMMQASGMAPGLSQADYLDIGQLGQVGASRENLERMALQDEMSRFQFGQQEPTSRIQDYMGIISGSAPLLGGAGTVTAQGGGGGGFSPMGTLGGAASGAAMGSMFGPIGMGVGALGGGLLGSGAF
ncbi:MAG: hypothetical protein ACR2RF_32350 [Geminicoccaceae bacterium]